VIDAVIVTKDEDFAGGWGCDRTPIKSGAEPGGRKFESCGAHHFSQANQPFSNQSRAELCGDS
jgi:hypothetical protein